MKAFLLRFLKLSERPEPPPGSEETLITFRSSKKALAVEFVQWGLGQLAALSGILVSLAIFGGWELPVKIKHLEALRHIVSNEELTIQLGPFGTRTLEGWMESIHYLELAALGFFFVQLAVSGFLLKLAWELRWYMVSDESLRLREGLWSTHERTMTVANIQNLSIRQGPLQKLLGLADLEVHTAGGKHSQSGDGDDESKNLHVGRFRSIEDAEGLRDRIRRSLKRHRGLGLGGDEDEAMHEAVEDAPPGGGSATGTPAAAAASELLGEARALRSVLEG